MVSLSRIALGLLSLFATEVGLAQGGAGSAPKTLVAVLAHADDEAPIAPLLARYAREGARVYMIIASDGSEGAGQQGTIPRPDSVQRGPELARLRADEARCSAQALGVEPPILLGFPDGKLGDYIGDRSLLFRLTQRIAEELQKLHPDAMVTWGPDGGVGHPDHRLVSGIVTQLARAGAPNVPERLFYMYIPAEGIRAMNPQRGEPPMLIPQAKYFTARVAFKPEDFQTTVRAMGCHRTQFTQQVNERVSSAMERVWNGAVLLIPAFTTGAVTDLLP